MKVIMESNFRERSRRGGLAVLVGLALVGTLALTACKTPEGDTGEEQRAAIRKSNQEILNKVYAGYDSAKGEVGSSVAYATFSSIDAKILFGGTGNGYGLLTDKSTGKQTFMRMTKLQVGIGLGVQELSLLLIFQSKEALKRFMEDGWTFGGGASAALKSDQTGPDAPAYDKSMQSTLDQDPLIYQVTNMGVNLSATLQGIKFSRDSALN